MIDATSLLHLTGVTIDVAGRRVPLLAELVVAGCVVGIAAFAAHRTTSRSSFATRATALHACTVLLLVFSTIQLVPRGMITSGGSGADSPAEPAWTRGPRIVAPRAVERALIASSNNDDMRVIAGAAVLVWICGASFMMMATLRGALQLAGIRCRARANPAATAHARALCVTESGAAAPLVLVSDEIDIPYACGWSTPAIIVPATCEAWTTREWQMVLHHESSHLARGDVPMQWVRQLVLALHWFNPAVHWLVRRGDEACEGACDDAVLLHGADAAGYAHALLSFADGKWAYIAAPSPTIVGRSGLERRVLAMVDARRRRRKPARFDRVVSRISGLTGGLMLAVVWPRPALAVIDAGTRQSAQSVVPNDGPVLPLRSSETRSTRRIAPPVATTGERRVQTSSDTTDALLGLGDALSDINPIVRDAAARALASWRSEASLARLKRVANSTDDSRRDAARAAITAMESSR